MSWGAVDDVIRHVPVILLDFDGPVFDIFGGYPARDIARELVRKAGAIDCQVPASDDPLEVLRSVAKMGSPAVTRVVADELRELEIAASYVASPNSHAVEAINAAVESGRRLAIVSNNSTDVVVMCLDRVGLRHHFAYISGRYDGMSPELMKPATHLLDRAAQQLDVKPWDCVLVGDSLTDIYAAHNTGAEAIGYANKPGKRTAMRNARAEAIIDSMGDLTDSFRRTPYEPGTNAA